MAVTIAVIRRNAQGAARTVDVDVTGPASYTTGGETLTTAQQSVILGVPVTTLDFSFCEFFYSERDTTGRQLVLDKTNNKMMFFAAGAEAASLANLSAVTIRCKIHFGQVTGE